TLVAAENSTPASAQAFAHTRFYAVGRRLTAITSKFKAKAKAVDQDFDADIANYEYNPADFAAAGNRYSIISFAGSNLEFDEDTDSSSLDVQPEEDGPRLTESPTDDDSSDTINSNDANSSHSNSAADRDADVCSIASTNSMLPEALAVAKIAEPLYERLSDRDRSLVTAALGVILDVNAGVKVLRCMNMKVYQVLFVVERCRDSGNKAVTIEALLMAASIHWLGMDKAVHWMYPMI
ncbi:hypothetical protein GGI18_006119, partial [Coemansia linderi]